MSQVIPALPATHEERLEYTQGLRVMVVDHLTLDDDGQRQVPKDKDERILLMSTLVDMDRTTLGAMKIKSDDAATKQNNMVAGALQRLSERMGSKDMFRVEREVGEVYEHEPPAIREDLLPEIDLVPGELGQGVENLTYKEFQKKIETEGAKPY